MKKINYYLFLILFISQSVFAQKTVPESLKQGLVPSRYNRNALTVIILDNNGSYILDIKNAIPTIVIPEKYDNNTVKTTFFKAESNSNEILNGINNSKLGNQILAKWFSRSATGEFDMTLIAQRGMYNATADDMIKASATKLGMAKIQDAGRSLVENSYIEVIDIRNVLSMQEYYDKQDAANRKYAASMGTTFKPVERTRNGWKGEVASYLYKIDPSVVDTLYEKMWIYNDDSKVVKGNKKSLFDNATFNFKFVMSANSDAEATQLNPGQTLSSKTQLTREELFSKLVNTAVLQTLYGVETKYEPFRVKTSVFQVHPIRAKIGTKEGLGVDQRYFVLENQQNKSGETVSLRQGVVYVRKVENNSTIATTTQNGLSTFYQTAGKRIEQGMTMQQRNDAGLGLSAGFGSLTGGMGGVYLKAEENIATVTHLAGAKNAIKITQLKAFFTYAFDAGNYLNSYHFGDYSFARMQVGLSKGFYFLRNFSIAPFIAYGVEGASITGSTDDTTLNTAFLNVGGYATINILYNLQLVGTVNYYTPFGNAFLKVDDNSTDLNRMYYYYFSDRKGLAIELGLRFEL
jgi:hypothetical protein